MDRVSLPDKYRFNEEYLANYRVGDKFPLPLFRFEGNKRVVTDPKHPLTKFVQFFIDNIIEFDYDGGVWTNIISPAWKEREFLNEKLGVPQLYAPTLEEMEKERHFGAIDRLKEYVGELEKAIGCITSKGIPSIEWPLHSMIETKKELDEQVERIIEAEGKPNFVIYRIG